MAELEGPGVGEPVADAEGVTTEGLDRELAELFGAFDDVRASDELKASTLDAIFAEMEAQEAAEGTVDDDPVEAPSFGLVQGGARPHEGEADADAASKASARMEVVRGRERRPRGLWLRVAAAALVITLTTGGVAYAIPASHVTVTRDDVHVDLAVNVFGRTVSVTSDDDELQAALDEALVRGEGYERALVRVLEVCDERADGGSAANTGAVTVEVSGAFVGEDSAMAETVGRVTDDYAQKKLRQTDADGLPSSTGQGATEPEATGRESAVRGTGAQSMEGQDAAAPSSDERQFLEHDATGSADEGTERADEALGSAASEGGTIEGGAASAPDAGPRG